MFIVWGSKGFERALGDTVIQCDCSHCNNEVVMQGKQIGRKFTLFWIPIFTTSSSHYLLCPICGYGKELSKEILAQYLVSSTETIIE
ncbi:zinc-ribbon domain-containing protein [Enterococcus plantarum]|uniref:Zinc-ribbon domain-containing protein n=1 Tax=Enterococcus plantarum TaxID=1077675 RepID=A0A2W3ZHR0_9ENTE|nr:zinc-ribbon domain-containing protein [Enterococcus plantarum]MBO0422065.1 zinc-ribbon domain-containing protein [Enterococcus plantarum]OEG10000.1 zinc-ribbon domain-containing protein [Enterococcus plantarum]PZL76017.1 zinc-ribbon domain-containing protein [Enterococcus plantarum]